MSGLFTYVFNNRTRGVKCGNVSACYCKQLSNFSPALCSGIRKTTVHLKVSRTVAGVFHLHVTCVNGGIVFSEVSFWSPKAIYSRLFLLSLDKSFFIDGAKSIGCLIRKAGGLETKQRWFISQKMTFSSFSVRLFPSLYHTFIWSQ